MSVALEPHACSSQNPDHNLKFPSIVPRPPSESDDNNDRVGRHRHRILTEHNSNRLRAQSDRSHHRPKNLVEHKAKHWGPRQGIYLEAEARLKAHAAIAKQIHKALRQEGMRCQNLNASPQMDSSMKNSQGSPTRARKTLQTTRKMGGDILISKDLLSGSNEKLAIIIPGSGSTTAGFWSSPSCAHNNGIRIGSIVPCVKEMRERGWPVMCLAPYRNYDEAGKARTGLGNPFF